MTTITMPSATVRALEELQSERPSFLSRIHAAIVASRQRQAEIEARRIRAILEDSRVEPFSEALLPLRGE